MLPRPALPAALTALLKLLGTPRDGALLRYSIGAEYVKVDDPAAAIPHLREAVTRDPNYSAAWKLLGRALAESGDDAAALDAYAQGIAVAEARGDRQAAKEMRVFAQRLRKRSGSSPG
jgi:predicted Zn-dependent protease